MPVLDFKYKRRRLSGRRRDHERCPGGKCEH
jgi:hypothetical protein